jgi:hypothetical protein
MLRCVALVITDVSEEPSASIIRVTRRNIHSVCRLLVKANVVPSSPIFCHPDDGGAKFLRNIGSTRATRREITEDGILNSHRRENLKSYKALR